VKKEWLEVKRIRVAEVVIEGVDLLDKVRKYKAKDNEMVLQPFMTYNCPTLLFYYYSINPQY